MRGYSPRNVNSGRGRFDDSMVPISSEIKG